MDGGRLEKILTGGVSRLKKTLRSFEIAKEDSCHSNV